MTVKAVIFDMDGVLVDTEGFYFQRRADFAATKGIDMDHMTPADFIGGHLKDSWRRILGDDVVNWDADQLLVEYQAYKQTHPVPYDQLVFPDAVDVVRNLHEQRIKLALASNSDRPSIERSLELMGLRELFDFVISGDECTKQKPDPEIYLQAQAALGIPKYETIIVEDSEKGIAAGVASGIAVWAIRDHRYHLDQSKATRLVASLAEVQQLVEENRG